MKMMATTATMIANDNVMMMMTMMMIADDDVMIIIKTMMMATIFPAKRPHLIPLLFVFLQGEDSWY